MRLVIIAIMAITAIGLMYSGWYYDGEDYEWDESYTNSHLDAFKWSGAAYFLAVAAFAYGVYLTVSLIHLCANTLLTSPTQEISFVFPMYWRASITNHDSTTNTRCRQYLLLHAECCTDSVD